MLTMRQALAVRTIPTAIISSAVPIWSLPAQGPLSQVNTTCPTLAATTPTTTSVDTQTEDKILNHLRDVMQGRTTIFISHRVSTVRNADRIAVLHGGRIVELGTHDELLAINGYYTDLYSKQLLEEELAEV